MILGGDEFARTQGGNNNAYCQDNEISWIHWEQNPSGNPLTKFVRQLTALRHRYPILRRSRFLAGEYNKELEIKDVTWIRADGAEMQAEDWQNSLTRCFAC